MKNHIRQLRARKGLTQRQLAERARTSQQQIQRIEAGVQVARIDLAQEIAAALETPIQEVFPGVRALQKAAYENKPLEPTEVKAAGVELDASMHRLVIEADGGLVREFVLSAHEKDRVRRVLMAGHFRFLVFDSLGDRWAINTEHLRYSQLLFDPSLMPNEDDREDGFVVQAWFRGDGETPSGEFQVDPDEGFDDELGNIGGVFHDLEMKDADEHSPVVFTDEDGEEVMIHPRQLIMMSAPLSIISPDLLAAEALGDEEDGVTEL